MQILPETMKLFDSDAYAVDFLATVLSAEFVRKKKDAYWQVVLDRTLFFPEEGGQTPDRGLLDGHPVIDVQLDGNVILHRVKADPSAEGEATAAGRDRQKAETSKEGERDGAPFVPGQTVRGQIDFAHRFSNMQNHSGEHILSGLVHNRFGYDNVGFHLSDNTVTLDFNGPLSDADIVWLEQAANRVVWDNREIRGWYPAPEELQAVEYRSKKEIDGPLRLVEIAGVDLCACCAPHVSHLTNMPREEIAAGTSRILEENEKLRQREAALEAAVTQSLASAVPAEQENVFLFTEGNTGTNAGIGNLAQRRLVNTLCEAHKGYCGVFAGSDEAGYRYIIGAAGNRDARVLNACIHKYCRARGGGKPAMVQGSCQAPEAEIRAAIEKALYEISES